MLTATNPDVVKLRAAKRNASLFLLVAFLIYCSSFLVSSEKLSEFLQTAGAAGTVGGLADWFAVTALFRRPLGLPIPHTALIPRKKDQIGASIARFVETSFLEEENLIAELRSKDVAMMLGRWLSSRETSHLLANMIAGGLHDMAQKGEFMGIVDRLIPLAKRIKADLRGDLENFIAGITGKIIPGFVDKYFAKKIGDKLDFLFDALATEGSPERVGLDAWIKLRIQEIPEKLKGPMARVAQELRDTEFLKNIGESKPTKELINALSDCSLKAGSAIVDSKIYRAKINNAVESLVCRLLPFKGQISNYIENTVKSWDTEKVTTSLENQVGKDLQFIRINGTVVGMLAGVGLFAVSILLNLFTHL